MGELQRKQDKEALLQKIVNMMLQAEKDAASSLHETVDMLVADGYDKEALIQEIVNRATNQGQSENACVRIIGEGVPIAFEDIKVNLPLIPVRIAKKGEKYHSVTAENDYILYALEKREGEDIISNINSLLDSLLPYKDYIRNIAKKYFLSLRLSLSSDFAQMYCLLPQEIMKKIAELHLNLEVSILSLGGVIDISDEECRLSPSKTPSADDFGSRES